MTQATLTFKRDISHVMMTQHDESSERNLNIVKEIGVMMSAKNYNISKSRDGCTSN
mgnify:CR=1 FL=1